MDEITNVKIVKAKTSADKTREAIAVLQRKLHSQEKHIKNLEDAEIVARYRSEIHNEDTPARLRQPNKINSTVAVMTAVPEEDM
ncbi:hypothetical protein FACS1894219_11450 [Clostridia bacterium]|nr:hypothetical protein FACS1894219_11450 [Clostridia bacterium]